MLAWIYVEKRPRLSVVLKIFRPAFVFIISCQKSKVNRILHMYLLINLLGKVILYLGRL